MSYQTIFLSLIFILILGLLLWGPVASYAVETPNYTVVRKEGALEIRLYPEMIIAQTTTTGERRPAIEKGFRRLADYIFGNNTLQQSIKMTAPVQQTSEEIAMTAPVRQQKKEDTWLIEFIMPSEYTLDTIPKPNDPAVRLISAPKRKTVSIRFTGFVTDTSLAKNLEKLQTFIKENELEAVSQPIFAFYNPPWTLPFLKRHEIHIDIEP